MKKALWFYILYVLFLFGLGTLILLNEKATLHEMLTIDWISKCSENFISFTDTFFKYITEIGGNIPFVVAAVFLFVRFGYSYFLLISQLAVTLVVQPIKHILNEPRPKLFFAENFPDVVLHQVSGVSMHSMFSFPSGHTATVFAFMLALSLICKRTWTSIVFLLIAVLVGYSRIYLSQHFAEDVFAGSIIGVAMASLTYLFYVQKNYEWQKMNIVTIYKMKLKKINNDKRKENSGSDAGL